MGVHRDEARGSGVVRLTREEALALRVSKHYLDHRAPARRWLQVLSDIGGLQAQSMNAAHLALWARVEGLSSEFIEEALLRRRTIVKVYGMRGTVHVLASKDYALYMAGLRAGRRGDTLRGRGLPPGAIEEARRLAMRALLTGPITMKELAAQMPANLRGLLTSSGPYPWHALIKDLLDSVGVCFGPPRGQEVTFVGADRWLPQTPRRPPIAKAEQELARRYLRAFAPATRTDFAYWSGLPRVDGRRVFDGLGEELVEASVDGQSTWMLRDDLLRLEAIRPMASARLMPNFDTYLLGHKDKTQFLDAAHHKKVFPGAGRVAQTILSNGRVIGTWSAKHSGDGLQVRLSPFGKLPRATRDSIEDEAVRLATFLGVGRVEVSG